MVNPLQKSELRAALVEKYQRAYPKSSFSSRNALLAINTILEKISNELRAGNRVEVRKFGTFFHRQRKPYQSRNPLDGSVMHIRTRTLVGFRPGKILQQRIEPSLKKED